MKIAILNNYVPFSSDETARLAETLCGHLKHAGHMAEIFKIPFCWRQPEDIIIQALACTNMRLPNTDLVIGLKFPAYLIPHPNKIAWLTSFEDLPVDIQYWTKDSLGKMNKIFAGSVLVAEQLKRFYHIDAEEILFPSDDAAWGKIVEKLVS